MAQMTVEISIDELAKTISDLSDAERETLLLLLSEQGDELLRRKEEIENGNATFLTEAEVFERQA